MDNEELYLKFLDIFERSENKSRELIKKLKTLGSTFDNESFNRRVLLDKRVKSMNDRIFKNLDSIYAAISTNSQISPNPVIAKYLI